MNLSKYNNSTIGVNNISASTNASEITLRSLESRFGELFSSQLAGGTQLMGVVGLIVISYMMYKVDVGEDIGAVIMVPTVFLFASNGWLPFGQGIIYGMILAVSAIFIFGVIKWADR